MANARKIRQRKKRKMARQYEAITKMLAVPADSNYVAWRDRLPGSMAKAYLPIDVSKRVPGSFESNSR